MPDSPPPLLPAYYSAQVCDFLRADPDAIYGALSRRHAHVDRHDHMCHDAELLRTDDE